MHVRLQSARLRFAVLTSRYVSGFKFSQLEMSMLPTCSEVGKLLRYMFTEVVLAVMLRSFRFTPSDKEVYWNLGGVNYPTIGKVSNKPELPIKVQAIA